MRILHCSDFHAVEEHYRWLIEAGPDYDLICLTGDLLDLNPYRSSSGQLDKVIAYLNQIRAPLAICSGNHDSDAGNGDRLVHAAWLQELRRPNLWLDRDSFRFGDYSFRIIPWMCPPPRASAEEIWLIHAPPDLTPTSIVRGGVDFGDFELGELCRSGLGPQLILCGHVHERTSWNAKIGRTWCLNPGRTPDVATPNHIVIDTRQRHAVFHGAPFALGNAKASINLSETRAR